METLLEGVRASVQPCSLALVVPALGVTVLGRRRGWAVALGFLLLATTMAWAQASVLIDTGQGVAVGLTLSVVAIAGIVLLLGLPRRPSAAARVSHALPEVGAGRAIIGGGMLGGAAGLLWQPCVGQQLGTILSSAPADPFEQLIPMLVYVAGLLISTVAVAALPVVWPRLTHGRLGRALTVVGALPLVVLITVLATGRYGQVIGALVRASGLA